MAAESIDTPGLPPGHEPASTSLAAPPLAPPKGRLEIDGNGMAGETRILLDGRDLASSVSGLRLAMGVRQNPMVELDLPMPYVSTIAVDRVEVHLPDDLVDLLLHLGWSPPGADKRGEQMPAKES